MEPVNLCEESISSDFIDVRKESVESLLDDNEELENESVILELLSPVSFPMARGAKLYIIFYPSSA